MGKQKVELEKNKKSTEELISEQEPFSTGSDGAGGELLNNQDLPNEEMVNDQDVSVVETTDDTDPEVNLSKKENSNPDGIPSESSPASAKDSNPLADDQESVKTDSRETKSTQHVEEIVKESTPEEVPTVEVTDGSDPDIGLLKEENTKTDGVRSEPSPTGAEDSNQLADEQEPVKTDTQETERTQHAEEIVKESTPEEVLKVEVTDDSDPKVGLSKKEDSKTDGVLSEPSPTGAEDANQLADDQESVKTDSKEKETTQHVKKKEPADKTALPEADHDKQHEEGPETETVDFSHYNKEQLVAEIEKSIKDQDIRHTFKLAKELKHFFDDIRESDHKEALDKFVQDGGEKEDFDYKPDKLVLRFDAAFQLLSDKHHQLLKSLEKSKEENLELKNELLERLRQFVDSDETNTSIHGLKDIQNEWKNIRQVPRQYAKGLWANYNALIDRFYDNRSIYFELKELDRRKNLLAKIELCERAEKLAEEETVKKAVAELNELHEEFKHIGPVPKEDQESLWQRFKAASDLIYVKRKEYYDSLKTDLLENLKTKEALGDKIQTFVNFTSEKISEWNHMTQELLAVQKEWESIGGLPRDQSKQVNKHFWSSFKTFFNNKNAFFRKLDGLREENLAAKQNLVEKAEELKESSDWQNTAEVLKQLQKEWRDIGPVPEKHKNKIYIQFKQACDTFFDRKRAKNKELEKDFDENLKKKEALCEKIEGLAQKGENPVDQLDAFEEEWSTIGFVPRRVFKAIQKRYEKATKSYIEASDVDDEEKQSAALRFRLGKLLHGPNSPNKIFKKELNIKKQIDKIESDLATWKNNMGFFTQSKNADKLMEDFNHKIDQATDELSQLKKQLKILSEME